MKRTFLFATIASILSINAFADPATITTQDYVDTADALKQDKITAGTTGNVVLYNGTQNGQTQFSERAIYDGTNDYDETTDANKLITAGAVNTMAPELPTGTPGHLAGFDADGDIISSEYFADERANNDSLWSGEWAYPATQLVTVELLQNNSLDSSEGVLAGNSKLVNGYALRRATADAATYNNGTLTNGNYFATINAVETKQNKMTCTRWIDNAAHTDANCLLWNMAN